MNARLIPYQRSMGVLPKPLRCSGERWDDTAEANETAKKQRGVNREVLEETAESKFLKKEKNGYRTHGFGFRRKFHFDQPRLSPVPFTLLASLHGLRRSESTPVGFHRLLSFGKNS